IIVTHVHLDHAGGQGFFLKVVQMRKSLFLHVDTGISKTLLNLLKVQRRYMVRPFPIYLTRLSRFLRRDYWRWVRRYTGYRLAMHAGIFRHTRPCETPFQYI